MSNLIPRHSNWLPRRESDDNWLMTDFFRPFFTGEMWKDNTFRVDVKDNGDNYLMEAELPGVKKEDVQINVEDGMLTITATMNNRTQEEENNYVLTERRSGSFTRSFSLENIREDEISAAYTDGILRLTLPKKEEPQSHSHSIEIH